MTDKEGLLPGPPSWCSQGSWRGNSGAAASLAVLVAPNFLVFGTFVSMDAFDQLFQVSERRAVGGAMPGPRCQRPTRL